MLLELINIHWLEVVYWIFLIIFHMTHFWASAMILITSVCGHLSQSIIPHVMIDWKQENALFLTVHYCLEIWGNLLQNILHLILAKWVDPSLQSCLTAKDNSLCSPLNGTMFGLISHIWSSVFSHKWGLNAVW